MGFKKIQCQRKQGKGRHFGRSEVVQEAVFRKQLGNNERGGWGSRKQMKNHK